MLDIADRLQKVALLFILFASIIVASVGASVGSVLTYRYFSESLTCPPACCQPCKCVECECCEGCCK